MINCVSIICSWDTVRLPIINDIKCLLTFWYAYCLSRVQCGCYVVCCGTCSVFIGDWGVCAIRCNVTNIGL
jgi:hypothetical protein